MRDLVDRLIAWLLVALAFVWGVTLLVEMVRPLIGWIVLGGLVALAGWFWYRRWTNSYW